MFYRLLKKGEMQVEPCEIPFAGALEILRSKASRPQSGASGRCRYDYRVGFPPAYKAGYPADLPARRTFVYAATTRDLPAGRRNAADRHFSATC